MQAIEPELRFHSLGLHARAMDGRLIQTAATLPTITPQNATSSFLQAIEGEAPALDALFQRISGDPRHGRVATLLRREIDVRHFGDWSMGFVASKYLSRHLAGYSDYLRVRGEPDKSANAADRVLAGFREGRFRGYVTAR